MEPTGTADHVEFETRRLMPSALGDISRSHRDLLDRRKRMVTRTVIAAAVVTSVVVAALTARMGLSLGSALCTFVGVLPAVMVAAFLGGSLFHLGRASRELAARLASDEWQRRLSSQSVPEQVSLTLLDTGLLLSRGGERRLIGFQRVVAQRSHGSLVVEVAGDRYVVPPEAFLSHEHFEAFVLALLGRVSRAAGRP